MPDLFVVGDPKHGASDGFLLSRVGRGQDLMVARSVPSLCGLSRHDELVGVGVVGAVVHEVGRVSIQYLLVGVGVVGAVVYEVR